MRSKHKNGELTFTLDKMERDHTDTTIGWLTTLSVAATGDLAGVAGDMVTGINRVLELLAEQGKPKTNDDAAPDSLIGELAEQTVVSHG